MTWFGVVKSGKNKRTATHFQTKSIRKTLLAGDATTKEILNRIIDDREIENAERLSGKVYTDPSGKRRTLKTLSSNQIPMLWSLRAILLRHPSVERVGKNSEQRVLWRWIGD